MQNLSLEYGRQLYHDRYQVAPKFRFLDVHAAPGSLELIDASNEIHVLYDVSMSDQAFKIKSDTCIIDNLAYFKNNVPSRPYDLSGNILIDTTGATETTVFTFLVFNS